MSYMEGSILPKVTLLLFLLSVVGVTTFYQITILNQEEEGLTEAKNHTGEQAPADNLTGVEEALNESEGNFSLNQTEGGCFMPEGLPEDVIDLHRMVANLSQENRLLNRTIEDQKTYIQDYKREKQEAERDLRECLIGSSGK